MALNWNWLVALLTAKRRAEEDRHERIEEAYMKLRRVCEPWTLDPDGPGNRGFMKSDARDFVNLLRSDLKKSGEDPPSLCTSGDASLKTWFEYFGELRLR